MEVLNITINERIVFLRKEILKDNQGKKLSIRIFADKLGVNRGVIDNIEYDRTEAKDNVIKLISLTFNVREEWLREGIEPIFNEDKEKDLIENLKIKYNLDELSTELIRSFATIDKNSKDIIINFLLNAVKNYYTNNPHKISDLDSKLDFDLINKSVTVKEHNDTTQDELSITDNLDIIELKLYETSVSAGTGNLLSEDENYEIIQIDLTTHPQARRADFALKVRGDSMEPRFYDGDIVFVKEQPCIDSGQIGIFIYDGESYMKKYCIEKNKACLVSLNEKYPPIEIIEYLQFKICGIVL